MTASACYVSQLQMSYLNILTHDSILGFCYILFWTFQNNFPLIYHFKNFKSFIIVKNAIPKQWS
jgi:hypothetical protein